jgi:hypothetical protein
MAKQKRPGHYCWGCGRYRAHEKFSGKGHRQHLCKDCHREHQEEKRAKKRATQQAAAAGLPAPKHYPMTRYQAASYLGITPAVFDARRKRLELQPCGTYAGQPGTGYLYDMAAILAVYEVIQTEGEAE